MIISLEEARTKNPDATRDDIMGLEKAIIEYTNNHFHLDNYRPRIGSITADGKIYFRGANLFREGDTIELAYTNLNDGFYHVEEVGQDFISTGGDLYPDTKGEIFLIRYPKEFAHFAKKIINYQIQTEAQAGIKSKSISRVTISYDTGAETKDTKNGLPARFYDFLEPYKKVRW